jgi:tetratricopeptide (TPR) repeat protein
MSVTRAITASIGSPTNRPAPLEMEIPSAPIRHHFGITSFAVNTWTGREAGDRIVNEHDEAGENEELYDVQSGRAPSSSTASVSTPRPGTFVFARPGVKRTAYAAEPGTTILVVGGSPGQAYEADGWEIWAPFNRLYLEGRYAEAADGARGAAKEHPDYAGLLYNLACCESLAGRTDDAIEDLRVAIDRSERFRSFAADDSDFRAIRDETAFRALVAG